MLSIPFPSNDEEEAEDDGTLLDLLFSELSSLTFALRPVFLPRPRREWAERLEADWETEAELP